MAKRPRLTLCMIALDEEGFIGDCLRSVQGLVEEIVVGIDTRTTDRTAAIAITASFTKIWATWRIPLGQPTIVVCQAARILSTSATTHGSLSYGGNTGDYVHVHGCTPCDGLRNGLKCGYSGAPTRGPRDEPYRLEAWLFGPIGRFRVLTGWRRPTEDRHATRDTSIALSSSPTWRPSSNSASLDRGWPCSWCGAYADGLRTSAVGGPDDSFDSCGWRVSPANSIVDSHGNVLGCRDDLVRLIQALRENRSTLALWAARGMFPEIVPDLLRQASERVGTVEGLLQRLDFATLDAGPLGAAIAAGVTGSELDAIVRQVSAQTLAPVSGTPTRADSEPSRHRARRALYRGGNRR